VLLRTNRISFHLADLLAHYYCLSAVAQSRPLSDPLTPQHAVIHSNSHIPNCYQSGDDEAWKQDTSKCYGAELQTVQQFASSLGLLHFHCCTSYRCSTTHQFNQFCFHSDSILLFSIPLSHSSCDLSHLLSLFRSSTLLLSCRFIQSQSNSHTNRSIRA